MEKNKARSRFIVLCVAPAVVLFVIFMIIPTLNVFRMSLFERGAYSPTETFVGFENFKALTNDTYFIRAMQNTILLIVVVTMMTLSPVNNERHHNTKCKLDHLENINNLKGAV